MNTKKYILLFIALLILVSSASAQNTDRPIERGCCTNAKADNFCVSNARNTVCCNIYEYTTDDAYNLCLSQYFIADQDCPVGIPNNLQPCDIICCVGNGNAEMLERGTCLDRDLRVDTASDVATCAVNNPPNQCNDGKDNDNDGCPDLADSGCNGAVDPDNSEAEGPCSQSTTDCTNSGYKPIGFSQQPPLITSQFQVVLSWFNKCPLQATNYEIFRKDGSISVTGEFIKIGQSDHPTATFTDTNTLNSKTTYTYKVVAHYQAGAVIYTDPSATVEVTMSSKECAGKTNDNHYRFCIGQKGYECEDGDPKEKKICTDTNQICAVDSRNDFQCELIDCKYPAATPFGLYYTKDLCEKKQDGTFRNCYYDNSKTIVNSCFPCLVNGKKVSCYDFKSQDSCMNNPCSVKDCQWKNYENDPNNFKGGVCVNTKESNCNWCDESKIPEADRAESFESVNFIFNSCTPEKAELLSLDGHKCYYNSGNPEDCKGVYCNKYKEAECVQLDDCDIGTCKYDDNKGMCYKDADKDPAPDCLKKTDAGEEKIDPACEMDYFPPQTTIRQDKYGGVDKFLYITIMDRSSLDTDYVAVTNSPDKEYVTYFCKGDACNNGGGTWINVTTSRRAEINGLDLIGEPVMANKMVGGTPTRIAIADSLIRLTQGNNEIWYRSQDPSKNLELPKKIEVMADKDSVYPSLISVGVLEVGSTTPKLRRENDHKIYAGSIASIEVLFRNPPPSDVDKLKLIDKSNGQEISYTKSSKDATTWIITPSPQLTEEGKEYQVNFDARKTNAAEVILTMPKPCDSTANDDEACPDGIIIDKTAPTLEIKHDIGAGATKTYEPLNEKTITALPFTIRLEFTENVGIDLESVKIKKQIASRELTPQYEYIELSVPGDNGAIPSLSNQLKKLFTQAANPPAGQKIFEAAIIDLGEVDDGNYKIEVTAKDFAGHGTNPALQIASFTVNANPFTSASIWLVTPVYGISPNPTFDIVIETDDTILCHWGIGTNPATSAFTDSNDVSHTLNSNSITSLVDGEEKNFNVNCGVPPGVPAAFPIGFDTSAPGIRVENIVPGDDETPEAANTEFGPFVVSNTDAPIHIGFKTYRAEQPATLQKTICTYRIDDTGTVPLNTPQPVTKDSFKDTYAVDVSIAGISSTDIAYHTITLDCESRAAYYDDTKKVTKPIRFRRAESGEVRPLSVEIIIPTTTTFYVAGSGDKIINQKIVLRTTKAATCYLRTDPAETNPPTFTTNDRSTHTYNLPALDINKHTYYLECRDDSGGVVNKVLEIEVKKSGPVLDESCKTIAKGAEKTCSVRYEGTESYTKFTFATQAGEDNCGLSSPGSNADTSFVVTGKTEGECAIIVKNQDSAPANVKPLGDGLKITVTEEDFKINEIQINSKKVGDDKTVNINTNKDINVIASFNKNTDVDSVELKGPNPSTTPYQLTTNLETLKNQNQYTIDFNNINLVDGSYTLTLNAHMTSNPSQTLQYIVTINIDKTPLTLEVKSKNKVIAKDGSTELLGSDAASKEGTKSKFPLTLKFNNNVRLTTVELSGGNGGTDTSNIKYLFGTDLKMQFDTASGSEIALGDTAVGSSYKLHVVAEDNNGNTLDEEISFKVNSFGLSIFMINPRYLYSDSAKFNLEIETNNEADCAYEFSPEVGIMSNPSSPTRNKNVASMSSFTQKNSLVTVSGSTHYRHTKTDFDITSEAQSKGLNAHNDNIYKLYVKCANTGNTADALFDIGYSTLDFSITKAVFEPITITELPYNVNLIVETNTESVCTYKQKGCTTPECVHNFAGYSSSYGTWDNPTYTRMIKTHTAIISLSNDRLNRLSDGEYPYVIECWDKAAKPASNDQLTLNINTNDLLTINRDTKQTFDPTENVALGVKSNKKYGVVCDYYNKDEPEATREYKSLNCRDKDAEEANDACPNDDATEKAQTKFKFYKRLGQLSEGSYSYAVICNKQVVS